MQIMREEIFGPVIAVLPFDDDEEAIRLANDTDYGLAAGLWTADTARAIGFADRIQAGTVYINNYYNATTQSPVGGFKRSGYGRENGLEGMLAYLQTKSIWVSTAPHQPNPFP
jgi:aldehyde dehydrogenase (NAD+)